MKRYFYEAGSVPGGLRQSWDSVQTERMAPSSGYVLYDRRAGYRNPLGIVSDIADAEKIVVALNASEG